MQINQSPRFKYLETVEIIGTGLVAMVERLIPGEVERYELRLYGKKKMVEAAASQLRPHWWP